jgi:hypothetical protein
MTKAKARQQMKSLELKARPDMRGQLQKAGRVGIHCQARSMALIPSNDVPVELN